MDSGKGLHFSVERNPKTGDVILAISVRDGIFSGNHLSLELNTEDAERLGKYLILTAKNSPKIQ